MIDGLVITTNDIQKNIKPKDIGILLTCKYICKQVNKKLNK
jgi:hypothetical protein